MIVYGNKLNIYIKRDNVYYKCNYFEFNVEVLLTVDINYKNISLILDELSYFMNISHGCFPIKGEARDKKRQIESAIHSTK